MLKVRVIPTLLWKDVGLVKGVRFGRSTIRTETVAMRTEMPSCGAACASETEVNVRKPMSNRIRLEFFILPGYRNCGLPASTGAGERPDVALDDGAQRPVGQ